MASQGIITYIACIVTGKGCRTIRKIRLLCVSFDLATARIVTNGALEDIALIRLSIKSKPGALCTVDYATEPLAFFYAGNVTNALRKEK